MTPSQLKSEILKRDPDNHFFDRKTMKFFGDSMRNYGVQSYGEFWELYRKRPVKLGLRSSVFFRKADFSEAYNVRGES